MVVKPLHEFAVWFLMVEDDPTNVIRKDPESITYSYWSGPDQAWVEDNRLFDWVDGPERSRRDAMPATIAKAREWMAANTNIRPAIETRAVPLDVTHSGLGVEHLARSATDLAHRHGEDDAFVRGHRFLARSLGVDPDVFDDSVSMPPPQHALVGLIRTAMRCSIDGSDVFARYLEAPTSIVRIHQEHHEALRSTSLADRHEALVAIIRDALVALEPMSALVEVERAALAAARRGAIEEPMASVDTRALAHVRNAPVVFARRLRDDAVLLGRVRQLVTELDDLDRAGRANPWYGTDRADIASALDGVVVRAIRIVDDDGGHPSGETIARQALELVDP